MLSSHQNYHLIWSVSLIFIFVIIFEDNVQIFNISQTCGVMTTVALFECLQYIIKTEKDSNLICIQLVST